MRNLNTFVAASTFSITLIACGENVRHVTESDQTGSIPILEKGISLPDCGPDNKGHMIFVEDSLGVFFCDSEHWQPVKGEQGINGVDYTPSTEFLSGSIVLTSKATCPSGKTCKHAPTTQLNTNIKYGEILDTRDNQIYNTVKIGTQVWMAQNLNYASTTSQCYKGIADNCNKYGRIYTWNEAMGSDAYSYGGSDLNRQGLCPSGWRIPTRSDWQTLTSYAGGTILDKSNQWGSYKIAANSAYNLQSLQSWTKSKATDKYGFSIIQGGYRWDNGDYTAGSLYWTSTYCNTSRICRWGFWDGTSEPELWYDYKTYRFSVRCIKK